MRSQKKEASNKPMKGSPKKSSAGKTRVNVQLGENNLQMLKSQIPKGEKIKSIRFLD